MTVLSLAHLFYGTTPCVVSILAVYLTELQSVYSVLTSVNVLYASNMSLYSFLSSTTR